MNFLNGLQVKSITTPPKDLNEMYTLASTWLKPKVGSTTGVGSTYATRIDSVTKKEPGAGKQQSGKTKIGKTPSENEAENADKKTAGGKQPKSGKNIECFVCSEDHYASTCPNRKKGKNEDEEQFVNVALEANTYHTQQVLATGFQGFRDTEV